MEECERFIDLPIDLDPLAAHSFAAPERALAGDADPRHAFGSRRRLDADDEFREFLFKIFEIGQ
jgi:hypothetical protein